MCWFQTAMASCSCFYHVDHTDQLLRHQPTLVLVTESLETESTIEEEEKEEKEDDDNKLEEVEETGLLLVFNNNNKEDF